MPSLHHLELLLWIAPALASGIAALLWFRLASAQSLAEPIGVSGFAAARRLLDSAGATDVSIQPTPGYLSDHYESHTKTLQLSNETYHGRSPTAVGVAAQVAGCALQHAANPLPALLHNTAAIGASFGCGPGMVMAVIGVVTGVQPLVLIGVVLFNAAFVLQIVCLPLQWDACLRAKTRLVDLGLFDARTTADVVRIMNASSLLGLAAVLQPFTTMATWIRG